MSTQIITSDYDINLELFFPHAQLDDDEPARGDFITATTNTISQLNHP